MTTPADTGFDFAVPIDRWAVRLDEPHEDVPITHLSGIESDLLPFPLEVPSEGFQPRLIRFGDAA